MAPLSVEKARILHYVAAALGEEGSYDVKVELSFPPRAHEIAQYLSVVESVELHLGIPCDRANLKKVKPVGIDLYLPGRDLYFELDRAEHDFTEARAITLDYYPPGLPKGFRVERWRSLIGAQAEPAGSSKMNAGRGISDFVKDLYVEGVLGKVLVRLKKEELTWLLDRGPDEPKLARLRGYLAELADELSLEALRP